MKQQSTRPSKTPTSSKSAQPASFARQNGAMKRNPVKTAPDTKRKHNGEAELDAADEHLHRVRSLCTQLPGVTEKLSHGEPTFFVNKRVFAMFDNNHHDDGHIAVWVPAPPGLQATLVRQSPRTYFKPPYVGVRGWIGIELREVSAQDLLSHIYAAWRLIAPKKLLQLQNP